MKHIFSFLILCILPLFARADYAETASAIFDPMMRTLTATLNGNLMADPVITLGSNDELTFSFDEIASDRSYLRCRLLHCNADWQPSRLLESEYVDGFNFAEIEDIGFSSNTFIRYVNYHFTLGKDGLLPLASGNYLWQVYEESEPDTILLQCRFRVAEGNATIVGEASSRTDAGINTEYQQVNAAVVVGKSVVDNPYSDIILEVTQNQRPDMSRFIEHPFRVEGDKIIYEHIPTLVFPAGNEYRRFETIRNDYPGMGGDSTRYQEPLYHAWLTPAYSRAESGYLYDSTQRGRYKVDEYNSSDPDLGADYIMTHFTLDFPEIMDGDVFIEGELALRGYTETNRMKYDREAGLYRLEIPLKQGSYNYQYVVRRKQPLPGSADGSDNGSDRESVSGYPVMGGNFINPDSGKLRQAADASLIEGNKFETRNEYNLYVWLRTPGSRADRLLTTRTLLSNQ